MGMALVVDCVCIDFILIVGQDTRIVLIELFTCDFDSILDMKGFLCYYVIFNCYERTVTLAVSGRAPVVWHESSSPPVRISPAFRAGRLLVCGCEA